MMKMLKIHIFNGCAVVCFNSVTAQSRINARVMLLPCHSVSHRFYQLRHGSIPHKTYLNFYLCRSLLLYTKLYVYIKNNIIIGLVRTKSKNIKNIYFLYIILSRRITMARVHFYKEPSIHAGLRRDGAVLTAAQAMARLIFKTSQSRMNTGITGLLWFKTDYGTPNFTGFSS